MQLDEIRLKCLEMAIKTTATIAHVVENARTFEKYVTELKPGTLSLNKTAAGTAHAGK